jgi:spermidine dehydrogenase
MIRDQLQGMFGEAGFDHQRDIMAITVNRWSHGYAWGVNTLVDDYDAAEASMVRARSKVGRVTIANADAGWQAYAHTAIDEAHRAVGEF